MTKVVTSTSVGSLEYQTTVYADFPLRHDQLATLIVKANFAEDWYMDACNEAGKKISDLISSAAARRREIIFSVCALESYILEWARDILLVQYGEPELLQILARYFPEGQRKPVTDKWKDVPKELYQDGLIRGTPDLSGQNWQMFKKQIYEYYRNSLIHATVSRPQKKEVIAIPAPDWKTELGSLPAGWAMRIVAELIRDLNDKAGTHAPEWLEGPTD